MSITSEEIRRGLEDLGLKQGMRIMVHSSLSSLGWVEGGAEAVIRAVQELIGPEGTLMMPSFNHGGPFRPEGPGVYDPLVTPTSNGRIPDTFWRMPDVHRSLNPTHPCAAWGKDAQRYTENHHLTLTMGEDSPLGMLALEGGHQINLGTSHASTTAKHVAETMRRARCLGYRTNAHPVLLPDGRNAIHRTWTYRGGRCPFTDGGEFIEAEVERLGYQRKGHVGESLVTFFRLQDLLEAIWGMLDNGYEGYPPCSTCPVRPRWNSTIRPSDWKDMKRRGDAGTR